jgi:hypothetical protein
MKLFDGFWIVIVLIFLGIMLFDARYEMLLKQELKECRDTHMPKYSIP